MKLGEFVAKRKAHIFFAGAITVVLALNIAVGFTEGRTFPGATWNALSEIRPMDYLMLALFWYAYVVHHPKDGESSIISLNLSRENPEK